MGLASTNGLLFSYYLFLNLFLNIAPNEPAHALSLMSPQVKAALEAPSAAVPPLAAVPPSHLALEDQNVVAAQHALEALPCLAASLGR